MKDETRSRKPELYGHLTRSILTLDLLPGSDLDESDLSRSFGLSRTPLREVFRQLAGEGYLDLRTNRTARVSDMTFLTLRDFFVAAPMIYGAILRLAARNAAPAQIEFLRQAQDKFRDALDNGTGAERALANNRFHEITGDMAGNVYLLPSFRRLLIDHARISMTFYRDGPRDVPDRQTEASQQHDAIIAALEAGDEDEAARLADAHWALSRDQIETFVTPAALDAPIGVPPRQKSA